MLGDRGLSSGKTLLLMLCPRPARLSVRWLSWEGRRPGSGICSSNLPYVLRQEFSGLPFTIQSTEQVLVCQQLFQGNSPSFSSPGRHGMARLM